PWDGFKAFQFESLMMAEGGWQAVTAAGGVDPGLARAGCLHPIADAGALARAEARVAAAADLWQGRAACAIIPAADAGALCPPAPLGVVLRDDAAARRVAVKVLKRGVVLHDDAAARIDPRRALAALAAALRARGAEICEGARDPGPAGAVIHATGAEGLAAAGPLAGRGVKGQALRLALALPAGTAQLHAPGLHVVPHADGTVAVGSTSEDAFEHPDTTDARRDALLARAVAFCPVLGDAPVIDRWAGVRPRAASGRLLLGALPGRVAGYVANGGFRIGFGVAPLAAERLADLVLTGRADIPPDFLPEPSPGTGAP
ncbi:MAG: NAD(P)/FAD-dependent oxidoreductase, partial [Gemmobacter sp.]